MVLSFLSLRFFLFFFGTARGEDFIKITVDVIVVDASSLRINKINLFFFLLYGERL